MDAARDNKPIRVGIIGASAARGWAALAHIPALRALPDDFTITAVSTSNAASAAAAGQLFGVTHAFDNHADLVNHPEVDLVVVAVRVPQHHVLVSAALAAGKAVYCEWPLGKNLAETQELAALARAQGVLAVTGLQARFAPALAYARELIAQGYVGEVLSTTLVGSGMGWGATVEPFNDYLNDKANGATMLSIPCGHALDALCHLLGEATLVQATLAVRRPSYTIDGVASTAARTSADQVAVTGLLAGGAPFAVHYRGGRSRGANLLWEINGTRGDLQLTAAGGHVQIFDLALAGGQDAQAAVAPLALPAAYLAPLTGPAGNIALAYAALARDWREGTHLCATFDDAVTRHRMLDAIDTAAASGQRQSLT
jgi:predicted dehydrogenase